MLFGKKLSLLFGFIFSVASSIKADTTIKFALRGDVGRTQPEGPERVNIGWYSSNGLFKFFLQNETMDNSWKNYTMSVPDDVVSLSVNFLNDRVLYRGGVIYDWNVRLDTNYFLVNGTVISNMTRQITGDFIRHLFDTNFINTMNNAKNGLFAWAREYVIVLPRSKLSTEDCDNPDVSNIICFDLRGVVGESILHEEERVKISYNADDGNTYVVHHDYPLTQNWQRIMIKPPGDLTVGRVVVQFLNDRVWNMSSIEYDRNVRLNLTSFEVNHKKVSNMRPYISGPVYDKWYDLNDLMRLNNVMSGNFAWNGEYHLNIPEETSIDIQANGCTGDSDYANAEDPREVCFTMKGAASSFNPNVPELIRITYTAESSVEYTLVDRYPISNIWETFRITNPGYPISSILVSLLNENELTNNTDTRTKYGVDVDLTRFKINGQKMNDTTPCFDTAPMKDGKLFINLN